MNTTKAKFSQEDGAGGLNDAAKEDARLHFEIPGEVPGRMRTDAEVGSDMSPANVRRII